MLKHYFDEELEFFRDCAEEFAQDYPRAAAALNLRSRDPDVEMLLQGCAFLSAHVRQELEAEFPELIHPLLMQTWPDALRPLPSAMMVQFCPRAGTLREARRIPKGVRLQSQEDPQPASGRSQLPKGFRFSFCTGYELDVQPVELIDVRSDRSGADAGRMRIVLVLQPLEGAVLGDRLRLYLAGEPRQSYGLAYSLAQQPRVRLRALDKSNAVLLEHTSAEHSELRVEGLGWKREHALLPYARHSFLGHRHLKEFFWFQEKYLLFDLCGLSSLAPAAAEVGRIEIELDCAALPTAYLSPPTTSNIWLNVTPAVNLFSHPAEYLEIDLLRPDYPLRPAGGAALYDIYAVQGVTATLGAGRSVSDQEFHSFPAFEGPDPGRDVLFYQVRPRPAVSSRSATPVRYQPAEISLSFVDQNGMPRAPTGRGITVRLLVTNRELPQAYLRPNEKNTVELTAGLAVPAGIDIRQISPLSDASPAQVGRDGLWRFLALSSIGWRSMQNKNLLCDLLRLYMPADQKGWQFQKRENLFAAIDNVAVEHETRREGTPPVLLRGSHVKLTMSALGFDHPGEQWLFGAALSHTLADMAPINTYTRLTIETPGFPPMTWPVRIGEQGLL